jgi:hypothetical protein
MSEGDPTIGDTHNAIRQVESTERLARPCRWCRETIDGKASVCPHCGRHQSLFWHHFRLEQIGLVMSFGMLVVAAYHLREAKRERVSAGDALRAANAALARAQAAELKLASLDSTFVRAQGAISTLEGSVQIASLILAAQNDDRQAYDQISAWANDESYPFRKLALNAWISICSDYGGPLEPGYVSIEKSLGIDPDTLAFGEVAHLYRSVSAVYHADLIQRLSRRSDLPRAKVLGFLIGVLKSDGSLAATYYAGKSFASATGQRWKPFDTRPLIEWWSENRGNIED